MEILRDRLEALKVKDVPHITVGIYKEIRIVAERNDYVLCINDKDFKNVKGYPDYMLTPYIVWSRGLNGGFCWGHNFGNIEEAWEDFTKRADSRECSAKKVLQDKIKSLPTEVYAQMCQDLGYKNTEDYRESLKDCFIHFCDVDNDWDFIDFDEAYKNFIKEVRLEREQHEYVYTNNSCWRCGGGGCPSCEPHSFY